MPVRVASTLTTATLKVKKRSRKKAPRRSSVAMVWAMPPPAAPGAQTCTISSDSMNISGVHTSIHHGDSA